MGQSTKERLLLEALKLFTSKPYDQVTFSDLEKVTNLSRGAILYHVKTKENMFRQVVDQFIFQTFTVAQIEAKDRSTLKKFIMAFVDNFHDEAKVFKEMGITNVNLAKLNIESQAFYFYKGMAEDGQKWYNELHIVWREVIEHAISSGEIRNNISPDNIASLFTDYYLGVSYAGIVRVLGADLDKLKTNYLFIYDCIKL